MKKILFASLCLVIGGILYVQKIKKPLIVDVEHSEEEEDTPHQNFGPQTNGSQHDPEEEIAPGPSSALEPPKQPHVEATQDIKAGKEAKISKIKESLHMEQRFQNHFKKMKQQFEAMKDQVGGSEALSFLTKSLSPEKMLKDYTQKLEQEFTEEELVQLQEKLNDPDYKSFLDLETAISDVQYAEDHRQDFEKFRKTVADIPEERKQLISRFDEASGISSSVAEVSLDIMKNMGLLEGQDENKVREDMLKEVGKEVQSSYLYSMKDFPDEKLEKVIHVAEDPKVARHQKIFQELNQETTKMVQEKFLGELKNHSSKELKEPKEPKEIKE